MPDEPGRQTRAAALETTQRQLREMWLAGGYRPERPEDQARWGDLIRELEAEHEAKAKRRERLAKWLATLALGLATAAAPILMPLLARLFGWLR